MFCYRTVLLSRLSHVTLVHQTEDWRLSEVNRDFSVCQSYPQVVTVPKSIDDESLRKVAAFRQGGRFPVLSYYHRKNGMVSDYYSGSCSIRISLGNKGPFLL